MLGFGDLIAGHGLREVVAPGGGFFAPLRTAKLNQLYASIGVRTSSQA